MLGDAGAAAVADALRDHRRVGVVARGRRAAHLTGGVVAARAGAVADAGACRTMVADVDRAHAARIGPVGGRHANAGVRRCRSCRRPAHSVAQQTVVDAPAAHAVWPPVVHVRSVDAAVPVGRIPPGAAGTRAAPLPPACSAAAHARRAHACRAARRRRRRALPAGAGSALPPAPASRRGVTGAVRVLAAAAAATSDASDASDGERAAPVENDGQRLVRLTTVTVPG